MSRAYTRRARRPERLYPLESYEGRTPVAPSWFQRAIAESPEVTIVDCEGARLEALSWGDKGKPGVLLLHGAMAHARWWSHIAPRLAEGRRVTALSWSGMGQSDWRDVYTVDQHAREAIAAADATGLFDGPCAPTVIAHSFGGHALLNLAARYGDRLKRAILLDSAAGSPTMPPRHPVRAADFESVTSALARFRLLPSQEAEPFVLDWLARGGIRSIGGAESQQRFSWAFDPDIFIKYAKIDDQTSLASALCQLVFIRGENSTVSTRAVEAGQKATAPTGTQFQTIPGASHHVMADQPLKLIETLRTLLPAENDVDAATLANRHSHRNHRSTETVS